MSEIGPIIIAIALIALVGAIVIAAIRKYDADSVVKILASLGAVIGFIVGGMGAFFFTRGQVAEKESLYRTAQNEAAENESRYKAAQNELTATQAEKTRLGDSVTNWAKVLKTTGEPSERERAFSSLEEIGTKLRATPAVLKNEKAKNTFPRSPFTPVETPSPDSEYKKDALFRPLNEEPTATASPP